MTGETSSALRSLIMWMKLLTAGACLAAVAVFVVIGAVITVEQDRAADERTARVDRSVEACGRYNDDQASSRQFGERQLVAVIEIFQGKDRARALEDDPLFADYQRFVAGQFPDRDCSRACVEALLNPDAATCPDLPEEP